MAVSASPAEADVVIADDADIPEGSPPVVLLGGDLHTQESLRSGGARVVLGADPPPAQIVAAIYAAAAGLVAAPAEEAGLLPEAAHIEEAADPLTPRELEVLEMLAEGLSNKLIAYRLSISDHTAKFHVNSILAKLNAGTRTEAVVRAVRLGLIKI
ncbi:MAG TPA: response regulator transcription factor [Bryobacteraceae bacterium]